MSTRTAPDEERIQTPLPRPAATNLIWLSLGVALLALAGSLWLSLIMKLQACPLCLYQRTFVMGTVAVLLLGLLAGTRSGGLLHLLALPTAAGGFGVAVFHEYLEWTGKLECPGGIGGIGSAPQQSLAVLAVLLLLLIVGAIHGADAARWRWLTAAALGLGVLFAVGAIASAPPPKLPPQPYAGPPEGCRSPFRSP